MTLRGLIDLRTDSSVQVMMATAGAGVTLQMEGLASPLCFNRAETFVVPAACGAGRLSARGDRPVTVIRAYLRAECFGRPENRWLKLD